MNFLKLCFYLVLSASILVSCTKKDSDADSKVLYTSINAEVKGLDPIYANDTYSNRLTSLVFEGLLEYHYLKRPYTLVPNLAESLPEVSADGLTYTFKIKKGVLFHDDAAFPNGKGRELVAEDFVYSIKRLADPKLQGLGWWILQDRLKGLDEWREKNSKLDKVDYSEVVEGLQALDSHTLQFKLKAAFPQFLYSLAMGFTFAVPKEAVEKYGQEFINHPVGTGPFVLPVFQRTNTLVFTKNKNYREKFYPTEGASEEFASIAQANAGKKVPLLEKIVANVIVESQPRWLNFLKGKLDYIAIPKDNFEQAVTPENKLSDELVSKGMDLLIAQSLDVTYTAFNHDLKLFKNLKLRQAMMSAFNIHESNKLFYNNTALPAQSVVPPGLAGYIKGYANPFSGPDIDNAKKLLAEAGYPNGKGLPEITYDCPSSSTNRQIAEHFSNQMSAIGIKIKIIQNSWPELQNKIVKRQVMLYGVAWLADYPDAENFFQLLYGPNKSPGANGSHFDHPEFNELFAKSRMLQDSPERTALYEQLYKLAAEQVPWIYGVHRQNFFVKHAHLLNYIATDFDSGQEQYLDIDLAKKKEALKKL